LNGQLDAPGYQILVAEQWDLTSEAGRYGLKGIVYFYADTVLKPAMVHNIQKTGQNEDSGGESSNFPP
jgi:hypothetical protein